MPVYVFRCTGCGAELERLLPLGGSGAVLMTRLFHHMVENGIRYGLQTMCEGGGMANATVLELL